MNGIIAKYEDKKSILKIVEKSYTDEGIIFDFSECKDKKFYLSKEQLDDLMSKLLRRKHSFDELYQRNDSYREHREVLYTSEWDFLD